MTYFEEIKNNLKQGKQYQNLNSNWYTINRPKENFRAIVINEEIKFYKTINSYAKRVKQLLNKGY